MPDGPDRVSTCSRNGIDAAVHRPLAHIEARAGTTSPDQWVAVVEARTGGVVSNVFVPARGDQAVWLTADLEDGGRRTAFVDPHAGRLLGVTAFGSVMEKVKGLPRKALMIPAGIDVAA